MPELSNNKFTLNYVNDLSQRYILTAMNLFMLSKNLESKIGYAKTLM